MKTEFTIGEYGNVFQMNVDADISDQTAVELELQKPDGTAVTPITGTVTDAVRGLFIVTIPVDTFDQEGKYRIQAKVTTGSGIFWGEVQEISVKPKFQI